MHLLKKYCQCRKRSERNARATLLYGRSGNGRIVEKVKNVAEYFFSWKLVWAFPSSSWLFQGMSWDLPCLWCDLWTSLVVSSKPSSCCSAWGWLLSLCPGVFWEFHHGLHLLPPVCLHIPLLLISSRRISIPSNPASFSCSFPSNSSGVRLIPNGSRKYLYGPKGVLNLCCFTWFCPLRLTCYWLLVMIYLASLLL